MNKQLDPDSLGYVSIPALLQYIESAERCGLGRKEVLAAAGLDVECLENKVQRIPGSALQDLLAYVIPQSGDSLFGLHTAQTISPSAYSVLGYIAMNAATVGEAIGKINQYEKLVGDMGATLVVQHKDYTEIQWHCQYHDPLIKKHLTDNVFASWVTYTRWLTGSTSSPLVVTFEHPAPANQEQLEDYQALFGCDVLFDQTHSAIRLDQKILQLPLKHADSMLLKTLEQHANQQLSELDETMSFSERVRHSLAFLLPEGQPRKEHIARYLNVSERTLQRRLQEESHSYQQILDQLRLELVRQYLQNPHLSNEEIAYQLGFQELRSFHRFFKKMMGITPGQYKKRHKL